MGSTRIQLLGSFEVVVDGAPVPADRWSRRQVATFVKLLALAPGRRLHREQVIDSLWPGVTVREAGPRLHKAAHYARRALGDDGAVLLCATIWWHCCRTTRSTSTSTCSRAWRGVPWPSGIRTASASAVEAYTGPLLPEDLYERWAEAPRGELRGDCAWGCSATGRWEDVLAEEPPTSRPTWRSSAATWTGATSGRRCGSWSGWTRPFAASWTPPQPAAEELRARPGTLRARASRVDGVRAGRSAPRRRPGARGLTRAEEGRDDAPGRQGPPGVGKSAVLALAEALARRQGWRTGRGTASAVEGPWPYAHRARGLGRPLPPAPRPPGRARTTTSATRSSGPCRAGTSPGAASRPPAPVPGGRRAAAAGGGRPRRCCSWWTTSTRPTRRRCGCCTTWPAAP